MRTAGLLAVVGVVARLAGCGTVSAAWPDGTVAGVVSGARDTPQQRAFADAVEQIAAADPNPRRADPESRRFASAEITERIIGVLAAATHERRRRRRWLPCG